MKGLVHAGLLASVIVLGSGCSEKCKNPKILDDNERGVLITGPAVQCNAVATCRSNGGRPDERVPLQGLEDPTIVDRHSAERNRTRCIERVRLLEHYRDCTFEVFPTMICLDAAGRPDGSGPDVTGPTGGTLVTVGVGAGSGDFPLSGDGAGGAGGAGGFSAYPGEDG